MHVSKIPVFLADLTHTAQRISALSFPLGAAFVASYATKACTGFTFRLFKFPEALSNAIIDSPPRILALSNYAWNLDLATRLAKWAKMRDPRLVVIMGGPNFPTDPKEKLAWLTQRPAIDFYIQNEGELGFAALLDHLTHYDLDAGRLKAAAEAPENCAYVADGCLVEGETKRIADVNVIPSPYLTGILDDFFEYPLAPMVETTRGCPFSCTYCSDGHSIKSRIERFDGDRVRAELDYVASRVKNIDELIITDLNFGMYKEDIETAKNIAKTKETYGWPALVKGSAGKNQPDRIIQTASVLDGSWIIGSAIQSSDADVLKNIKRSNISSDAYQKFIDYVNDQSEESQSYTEIILALPGDTREKHFNSLRHSVESRVNSVRMYQAMLLAGTEMTERSTREKYGLLTRFRVTPGCLGIYKFGEDEVTCAEIEEIIVGGNDMSYEDYVSCRVMNLIIEAYINNATFEEMFAGLRSMGISPFEILLHIFEHQDLYPERMAGIFKSFVKNTTAPLFETREQAEKIVFNRETTQRYLAGELGCNELLEHKAELYLAFDDMAIVLNRAVTSVLEQRGLFSESLGKYLAELSRYILHKKARVHDRMESVEQEFHYDFMALQEQSFAVVPSSVPRTEPTRLRFFMVPEQTQHIRNAYALYQNHPGGLGRMIQRSNLKKMYRRVERVNPATLL